MCSCRKHYREYLVSLINGHSLDPALLYDAQELTRACERYQVDPQRGDNEEDNTYHARLLKVRLRPLLSLWIKSKITAFQLWLSSPPRN